MQLLDGRRPYFHYETKSSESEHEQIRKRACTHTHTPGRTGRGVTGVTVTPLASDSKWCRTVNFQVKRGKTKETKKKKKKKKKKKNHAR